MNQQQFAKLISTGGAFRSRIRIQPAGGIGDKVFPPTFLNDRGKASYATEKRVVLNSEGEEELVDCVLLDSVQSQANRMEEALQMAVDAGKLSLPLVEVDFSGIELIEPIGKITSLQAPHRIADALLRDAELEGVPFRKSSVGQQLDTVSVRNATPLFQLCPTALIFGIWDSTGPKGGLGSKFQRALTSEIIGYRCSAGVKTSSRIDPLQIRAQAKVSGNAGEWKLASDKDKKAVSPAEINHGNIPPTIDIETGGVTIEYAEQTVVISLPALRRLRFPLNGKHSVEADEAARTVLLSLALTATALANESGLDLRSRCVLWPESAPSWEILEKPGASPEVLEINSSDALDLYTQSVEIARSLGLPFNDEPVSLVPGEALKTLLQRSQEIAVATGAGDD